MKSWKLLLLMTLVIVSGFSSVEAAETLSGFPVTPGQTMSEVQTIANKYGYQLFQGQFPSPGIYLVKLNQKHIGSLTFVDGLLKYANVEWHNALDVTAMEKLFLALGSVSQGRPITAKVEKYSTPSMTNSTIAFYIEGSNRIVEASIFTPTGESPQVTVYESFGP